VKLLTKGEVAGSGGADSLLAYGIHRWWGGFGDNEGQSGWNELMSVALFYF